MSKRNMLRYLVVMGTVAALVTLAGAYIAFTRYQADHALERAEVATPSNAVRHDLKAQQDVAEWAYSSLWISVLGVALTGTGIVFIALTLNETRKATTAANKAADAAVKANEGFIDSSERQMRAYITVATATAFRAEHSELTPHDADSFRIHCLVEFKNCGLSPALKVLGRAKPALASKDEFLNLPLPASAESESLVGPGATFSSGGHLDNIRYEQLIEAESCGHALWIRGCQAYEDIYGVSWELTYGFKLQRFGGLLEPMRLLKMDWVSGENSLVRTDGRRF